MAPLFPRSQQMAFIALTIIGRIGHLAIGAIFTRAVFFIRGEGSKNLSLLIPAKKPQMFAGTGEVRINLEELLVTQPPPP